MVAPYSKFKLTIQLLFKNVYITYQHIWYIKFFKIYQALKNKKKNIRNVWVATIKINEITFKDISKYNNKILH